MRYRGLGSCGTCAVQIRVEVEPPEWTTAERLRLNFPPHGPPGNQKLRLACQVTCQSDLEVTKYNKFWGEGDEVMPPAAASEYTLPLGQLEFVLDKNAGEARSDTAT